MSCEGRPRTLRGATGGPTQHLIEVTDRAWPSAPLPRPGKRVAPIRQSIGPRGSGSPCRASDRALSTYQAKRDLVCDGIAATGLPDPVRPAAGAFLLVDCSPLGDTPADVNRVLLRNGIATVRGADMHAPDTHVRLTFGSDEHLLGALLRGLARAYREAAGSRAG